MSGAATNEIYNFFTSPDEKCIPTLDAFIHKQRSYSAARESTLGADAQTDLRVCCSHIAKTGFLMMWLM